MHSGFQRSFIKKEMKDSSMAQYGTLIDQWNQPMGVIIILQHGLEELLISLFLGGDLCLITRISGKYILTDTLNFEREPLQHQT